MTKSLQEEMDALEARIKSESEEISRDKSDLMASAISRKVLDLVKSEAKRHEIPPRTALYAAEKAETDVYVALRFMFVTSDKMSEALVAEALQRSVSKKESDDLASDISEKIGGLVRTIATSRYNVPMKVADAAALKAAEISYKAMKDMFTTFG